MRYYILSKSQKEREQLDHELQKITGYYSGLSHEKDYYFNNWPVVCIDTIGGQIYSDIIRDTQYLTIDEIRKIFMKPKTKRYIIFWTDKKSKSLCNKIIARAKELNYVDTLLHEHNFYDSIVLDTVNGEITFTFFDKHCKERPNHELGDLEKLIFSDYYAVEPKLRLGEHKVEIKDDKLKVGCSTFEKEEVDKVIEAWNNRS